nr:reverse transcriptase domain-containing protein [Tanacetum cinerariifolium]
MSIRSSARNLFPPLDNPELTIRRRSRVDPTILNDFEMATERNGDLPVPDLRTLEELCQLFLNGRVTIDQTQNVYSVGAYQGGNSYQPQGASHGQNSPPAYQALGYQAPVHQPPIPQPQVVTTTEFTNYMKANDAILKNMETNMTSLKNSNLELKNMFGQFMKMNTASSLGSGTLPMECETEVTKDTVPPTNNGSTKDVQPLVFQIETPVLNSEPVVGLVTELLAAPVCASKPNQNPSIAYPSRLHDQKLRDKTNDQKEKIFQIFQYLNFNISLADALILMPKFTPTIKSLLTDKDKLFELARTPVNEHCSAVLLIKLPKKLVDPGKFLIPSVTFNLDQPSRYSANYNDMTVNRIDVIDMACEEYSKEVLGSSDVIVSGNPTPYYDPIVSTSSQTLTPLGDSDFLLEEVDAFLTLENDPTSSEGKYLPQVRKELKICEVKNDKSLIDEPPEVELKDLPPHLEYTFLEGDDKLPIIIAKDLSVEEKAALIKVLKSHKQAIAWKLSDIKVFMDDFLVFGNSFETCLSHLEKMLKRCEDTNLCLNWEKSHFMVKEGIVLGHKISKNRIEVDKAKVDVIAKLPHPTTVKGICSFLSHASFYRQFLQYFSKIARPMTRLLEKYTPFFSNECIEAF